MSLFINNILYILFYMCISVNCMYNFYSVDIILNNYAMIIQYMYITSHAFIDLVCMSVYVQFLLGKL